MDRKIWVVLILGTSLALVFGLAEDIYTFIYVGHHRLNDASLQTPALDSELTGFSKSADNKVSTKSEAVAQGKDSFEEFKESDNADKSTSLAGSKGKNFANNDTHLVETVDMSSLLHEIRSINSQQSTGLNKKTIYH